MTGTEFKAHRDHLLWTQAQASQALGITIAQISAIENGRSKVTKTVELLFSLYRRHDRPGHPQGIGRRHA